MEPTCRSSLRLGRSVCLSLPPPSPLIQAGTAPRAQPGALLTPLSPSPQLGALAVTLGVLLALLGCAAAPDPALEEAWEEWKSLHAKEYPGEDETFRREIWEKNLRHIQQHNWEEAQGKHSYRLAMNHFGDLTNEEFKRLLNGFIPAQQEEPGRVFRASETLKTPVRVDWRAKGYVTPVKNQRTGKLVVLSEQNLIDCTRKLGNRGCCGGHMEQAFQYVRDNGGLNSERVYPYVGTDNSRCRYNPRDKAANCSGFMRVAPGSEEALAQAVATVGPVSVSVDASSFRFYKSGLFGCGSGSWRTNHAMLAVGYSTTWMGGHNLSYWILKNSWTERWGEQGYMFLLKDAGNQCGVANQASYPLP
ncbi:cathepsin L1-like [Manacus vitellinus]|uniref:cathepsin L1-like n=1 Tax=Manacus vitellinus TaxID=328815 RepID=UPI00115DAA0F|nr:cathepsin L1-like [Manacus vitellinus]